MGKMDDPKSSEPEIVTENTILDNTKIQPITEPGVEPNISSAEPAFTTPEKRQKFMPPSRKKLIIMLVSVLLLAAGLTIYMKVYRQAKGSTEIKQTPKTVSLANKDLPLKDNTAFADKFLPDYSDMRGYAELGSEHWFVAFMSVIVSKDGGYRVFTPQQFDGITSFTGITKRDGQIWITGQGGAARYIPGSNSFKTYLKGELNVKLAIDPTDNTMYASTFKNAFAYNAKSDSFGPMGSNTNPISIKDFGFTKNYIVATSSNNNDTNSPIHILNKQTRQWSAPNNLKYYKANARSAEVNLMTIEGKIIVYGRHVDYQSCADQGKYPATVVYQFNENGSFDELTDLTTLFTNNEANGYAYSSTALKGEGCGDIPNAFVVDMKLENNKVVATNKRQLDTSSAFANYTYQDRVEQLESELGFPSALRLIHPQTDGSVFSVWQSPKSNALVSTKGAYKNVSKRATFKNSGNVLSYLECGGGQYVVDSTSKAGAFGPPFLNSIFKLEGGASTEVYKTTNKPLYEGVDAEISLANSEGICVNGAIVLLGPSELQVFDLRTNTFKKQDLGGQTDMELTMVNKARDGFNFVDTANFRFISVSGDVAQKKSVPFAKSALAALDTSQLKLFVFNDNNIVLAQSGYDKEGSRIVTFKAQDGSAVETTKTTTIQDGLAYDDNRFILQYVNGETKIINNVTHKGDVISKPASITSDSSFPIIKDNNSEFIAADGYVWFSASNWGVIGYKVP